jgi:hypothetical protein
MYYKVKITALPEAAYGRSVKTGQQMNGALAIQPTAMGGADIDQYIGEESLKVKKTMAPIKDISKANVEVEKDEVIMTDNGDGIPETYVAGGKRHSEGGTPLNLPDDSFIYSDTRSMRLKDPEILKMFGKKGGSYTPAELAKQYDINKYRQILQDPNSDAIDKKTAELMIRNYTMKLGGLALAQEGKKAFPQGIPKVAEPFMEAMGIKEEDLMPTYQSQMPQQQDEEEPINAPEEEMAQQEMMAPQDQMMMDPSMMAMPDMQAPMAAYGMAMGGYSMPFAPDYKYGGLYKAIEGVSMDPLEEVDPYEGGKTQAGSKTPTGKSNAYSAANEPADVHLGKWEKLIPGIKSMSDAQAQKAMYEWSLANDPDAIKAMWIDSGLTAQGLRDPNLKRLTKNGTGVFDPATLDDPAVLAALERAYVDGKFGRRQLHAKPPKTAEVKAEEPKVTAEEPETKIEIKTEPGKQQINRPDLFTMPMAPQPRVVPAEWTSPDIMNFYGALKDRNSLRQYFPWAAPVDMEEMEPTYLDPTRELAQQSEDANIASQALAMFTGPKAYSSRASQIQGQGAKQAANTLSRYNNANVGIANQFEQANVGIRNQERMANQAISKQIYDQTVLTNANMDRDKRLADSVVRQAKATGWKNASDIAMINATSDQYDIDPRTGNIIFRGGKKPRADKAKDFDDFFQYYRGLGLEPKDARENAKAALGNYSGYTGPARYDNYDEYKAGGVFVLGPGMLPPLIM